MGFISTMLSTVGGALGIAGDFGSARQTGQTALLNYFIDTENARSQRDATLSALRIDRMRSNLSFAEARANARLGLAEAQAQRVNADRLVQFADAGTRRAREAIRRAMRGFEELEGRQMAAVATAGVADSGSPLDVMANSAQEMALSIADMWEEASFERTQTLDRARMERWSADQTEIASRFQLATAKSARAIERTATRVSRITAQSQYRNNLFGASARLAAGEDAAAGQRLAGFGGIFAGAGSLYGSIASNRRIGA